MTYLDYNASTPVDPRVLEELERVQRDVYGNAASMQHAEGQRAAAELRLARDRVSVCLDVSPLEVVFTSGASEAIALGLVGAVLGRPERREPVVDIQVCREPIREPPQSRGNFILPGHT